MVHFYLWKKGKENLLEFCNFLKKILGFITCKRIMHHQIMLTKNQRLELVFVSKLNVVCLRLKHYNVGMNLLARKEGYLNFAHRRKKKNQTFVYSRFSSGIPEAFDKTFISSPTSSENLRKKVKISHNWLLYWNFEWW